MQALQDWFLTASRFPFEDLDTRQSRQRLSRAILIRKSKRQLDDRP